MNLSIFENIINIGYDNIIDKNTISKKLLRWKEKPNISCEIIISKQIIVICVINNIKYIFNFLKLLRYLKDK